MSISVKNTKILWANAAGRCSYPNCLAKLCTSNVNGDNNYTLGEMAHICGEKAGSNRHNYSISEDIRNSYSNLILLCPTHHTLLDKPENEKKYSVQVLQRMKAAHEKFIAGNLDDPRFENKLALAKHILPCIQQNYEIFSSYGPHSEIARKNPLSDAHEVWKIERLATIVPNNRIMATLLDRNIKLFTSDEQRIISKFLIHVRSYDRWVCDEISYESVIRYPTDFSELMRMLAHAGT